MRLRWLLLCVAFTVVAATSAPPAGAHTEVQRATPSPGEVVTGSVDSVDLVFLDPVLPTVSITVASPDGTPVDGLGEVAHTRDGLAASVEFDPLNEAGAYVVDYEFVATDGDAQRDAYRFTIEPAEDRASAAGIVVVALVVAGAIAALVVALRRRRRGASG